MAKKLRQLTDLHIRCDVPHWQVRWCRTLEEQAKALEYWVKEFHEFIRDHRSQDPVSLEVVRVYEDVCSECKAVWEVWVDEGKPICSQCGEEIEQG